MENINFSLARHHKNEICYFNGFVFLSVNRVPSADNVVIVYRKKIVDALLVLKNSEEFGFSYLSDVFAVDNFGKEFRFAVVYRVVNLTLGRSLMVVTFTQEGLPIASVQDIYRASSWPEREMWEMHGVYFAGHRQLQRLLTDYCFKGHPLRKDFPMTGYVECFYTYHLNFIEFVKVEFMQEYRRFEFYDGWEDTLNNESLFAAVPAVDGVESTAGGASTAAESAGFAEKSVPGFVGRAE